jgi:hypothetical protein
MCLEDAEEGPHGWRGAEEGDGGLRRGDERVVDDLRWIKRFNGAIWDGFGFTPTD